MANRPLLVVALDAGDPERMLAGIHAGALPVLQSLVGRGTTAGLFDARSVSVHGGWATLFSGRSVVEKGGYARRWLPPGRYALEPARFDDTRPFWAQLACGDVLTVDAPEVVPIAGLAGRQLADWGMHPTFGPPVSEPAELVAHARRLVGPRIASDERQRGGRWRDGRIRPQLLRRVERKGRLVRALMRERAARVVVVGFGDTHAAGHRYLKYATSGDPLARVRAEVYSAIDREIGQVIAAFDEEPNVFVLADSGVCEGQPLGTMFDDFCRVLGYKTSQRKPLGARLREAVAPVLPSASRTAALEARFLTSADWSRTSLFTIPSVYTGYLRVNLAGREAQGSVGIDAYDALLDRVTTDLHRLVDVATGDPVMESVVRTTEVFGGGPPRCLPDLFVNVRPCRLPQRISHPKATFVRRRGAELRDNFHSRRGIAIGAGPDIARRGEVADLAPCAMAPVFRTVLGEPLSTDARRDGVETFVA